MRARWLRLLALSLLTSMPGGRAPGTETGAHTCPTCKSVTMVRSNGHECRQCHHLCEDTDDRADDLGGG